MGDNEFYKIDKLMPYKTKVGRTYVKDGDLQIHLPNAKETAHLENAQAFNKLLSHYTKEVGQTHSATTGGVNEKESIRLAMEDAEQTFNSMMEISKQLRQACQELMQMQG
jgi:flagellar hook-basal body complex protein FliE